ncbi:hypothetical protein N9T55_00040 [Flavobacteriaceae bacterium]|nr:hypothetical protein [Flavobacteriaceae bacterium]
MPSKKNYKIRVEEFIIKGYDLSTIQKLIHREYAIRLKKSSINKIFLKKVGEENIHLVQDSNDKKPSTEFLNKINEFKDVKSQFYQYFTKDFTSIDEYDSKIRNLIRVVLRDNLITASENLFLKEKLKEYKLSTELIELISAYVDSKNPYYDEIFQMIWSDNVVDKNEIAFLNEKIIENSQQKPPINKRFWIYSIKNKYEDLLNVNNFRKIIKLNATNSILNSDYNYDEVFNYLDLFQEINDLEKIIEKAKEKFEELTIANLNNLGLDIQLEFIYQRIDLDFKKEFQTEKQSFLKDEKVTGSIEINEYYTKKELYSYLNVPVIQQGGKWNNGYCEHNDKWFIFCNINIEGKGYYDQNFNYSNSFDKEGNLNWEARFGSKIHWESISKLSDSQPYIFTKEKEGDVKWKYNGRGMCLKIEDTTPVKILWRILNKNIAQNESLIDSSEFHKDNDPYKEILELSKINMFKSFDAYKKIVVKNNPKINPRKIRKQFNELIEELD